jgi:tRNA A37 N6-isopentenylltransferase MiaA
MAASAPAKKYLIDGQMEFQSNEKLEQWAADANCIEQEACAAFLAKRKSHQAAELAEVQAQRALKHKEMEENPFDPRSEVSADAKHIANKIAIHLWILFVAFPLMLAILYSVLR